MSRLPPTQLGSIKSAAVKGVMAALLSYGITTYIPIGNEGDLVNAYGGMALTGQAINTIAIGVGSTVNDLVHHLIFPKTRIQDRNITSMSFLASVATGIAFSGGALALLAPNTFVASNSGFSIPIGMGVIAASEAGAQMAGQWIRTMFM